MLRVHRAERADRLADGLAALVHDAPADPFTPEVVAVPTRGVERWLTQRISGHLGARPGRADGVCANMQFPFPGRLVNLAVSAASGVDPASDPWPPARSVWALLGIVHDHLDEPWLAPLAAHLGPSRPFRAVRRIADLFDRYGVHRPEMVRSWAVGDDTDGAGRPLPADMAWQAELWRRLRDRAVIPSPAERLATACSRLRDDASLVDLPDRLSLFGLTRLPVSHLEVLSALGALRDVHLFLLHPSPGLWERAGDDPRNPLLAAWGRDVREMQAVLSDLLPGRADRTGELAPATAPAPASGEPTLLARVQAGVREDRRPAGPPTPGADDSRPLLRRGDRSVQVHACHGRARQVEVLRDAIAHALADDPTLEPRDVIVMCPDIDAFAPLIHAVFSSSTGDDGIAGADGDTTPVGGLEDLHVRLADRSIRRTNPVLGALAALLDLAGGRFTASEVVDFAGREPVRRRFRLDDDDLARIEEWIAGTGIRWGLDSDHRSPYKLGTLPTGTWRAGIDRLLTGVTMNEDGMRLVGGVLPLDDVDSGDIDLAGRFSELIDRLGAAVASFAGTRPLAGWAEAIAQAADALTATGERDAWQRAQLAALLDDVVGEQAGAGGQVPLDLDELRALLADRLRGKPTRANFRTGHLTMCTLVPMRSVPHRVVCLLGLDDGAFPRPFTPDGDDVMARAPRDGDPDPRSEDRQLLLDAVMSATDSLIVTYCGRDERTNEARPPAVPLGELLDVIDQTVRVEDGDTPARDRIVCRHPLQPFDARNYTPCALVPDRPWSFDPVALAGARAMASPARTGGRSAPAPLLAGPLPRVPVEVVELDDLVRFVQHPVRAFLRQRLGLVVRNGEEEPADALAVELDALERWHVGQRLLDALVAGTPPADCRAAELARGLLPPGALGTRILDDVLPTAVGLASLASESAPACDGGRTSVQVDVVVGDGVSVVGTVPDVAGDTILSVTFSRVGARHRLASWVRLLAATASHPDRGLRAVTIGCGQEDALCRTLIPPIDPDRAVTLLRQLVDLHARGLCEPLPLFEKTSHAYAAARAGRHPGDEAARREWETVRWDREDRRPEHRMAFGGVVPFDVLAAIEPAPDEHGVGWAADEPNRLGRLARRLWDPLLAVEQAELR